MIHCYLKDLSVTVEGLGRQEAEFLAAGSRRNEQLREALAEHVAAHRLLRLWISAAVRGTFLAHVSVTVILCLYGSGKSLVKPHILIRQ